MGRWLTAFVACAVLVGFAARPPWAAQPAIACTLGQFSVSRLPDAARANEVVAIGTFGEPQGAAIEFKVETYYKAPASKAETLLVNNLVHSTTPACEPVLTHLLAYEPGQRALLLLNRDDEGVGANWRPQLVGTIPIENDTVQSIDDWNLAEPRRVPLGDVRAMLEKALGPEVRPNAGLAEAPVEPVGNLRCLYGPYSLRWFAANAPVIAVGKVESADARIASVKVTNGLYGVATGESLRVDNRYYDAGHAINTCGEATSPGPKSNAGDELLLFLTREGSRELGGLRPAGVDGFGIYATSGIYDLGRQYSLDEAVALIQSVTATRPAAGTPTGGNGTTPPADAVTNRDDRTPLWLVSTIASVCGAVAGVAVVLASQRLRRSPR